MIVTPTPLGARRDVRVAAVITGGSTAGDMAAQAALGAAAALAGHPGARHPAATACRIAATLAELALGLAAMGLLPRPPVLVPAVLSQLGFLLMSPVRIMPFAIAGVGLLYLATTRPLLAGIS